VLGKKALKLVPLLLLKQKEEEDLDSKKKEKKVKMNQMIPHLEPKTLKKELNNKLLR